MRIVDIHSHLYPRDYLELLNRVIGNDNSLWAQAVSSLLTRQISSHQRMWDASVHIEAMDEHGIEMEVLSLSTPMSYFADEKDSIQAARIFNDALAEICARYPKRFKAFASLPLPHTDASLKELDRAINTLGLHGIGLGGNALHGGAHLDDDRIMPIYPEISRRGLPVFLHPNVPPGIEEVFDYEMWMSVGFLMDSTLAVLRLANKGVFEENKGMKFIAPHLGAFILAGLDRYGGRRVEGGRTLREYTTELFYDSRSESQDFWDYALRTVGSDHILFGSDYPFGDAGRVKRYIQSVLDLPIDDTDKELIMSGNADRLLGLSSE